LLKQNLIITSGLTPSDAAHVLGQQQGWSTEAAALGVRLWLRWLNQESDDSPEVIERFCRQVRGQGVIRSGRALIAASLAETAGLILDTPAYAPLRRLLVDKAFGSTATDLVGVNLTLRRPLVAIGAPVQTYYPAVAERLRTRLVIPPHADIANAVGAVAGGIVQSVVALIRPLSETSYRVHLSSGLQDFVDLEKAVSYATSEARTLATIAAKRSGAVAVQLQTRREDLTVSGGGEEVFFESVVTVTATGRPGLVEAKSD
jgi:N-methylhydantoinase A/oxoprolinase/acetone carboxylase beta subunit